MLLARDGCETQGEIVITELDWGAFACNSSGVKLREMLNENNGHQGASREILTKNNGP